MISQQQSVNGAVLDAAMSPPDGKVTKWSLIFYLIAWKIFTGEQTIRRFYFIQIWDLISAFRFQFMALRASRNYIKNIHKQHVFAETKSTQTLVPAAFKGTIFSSGK